MASNYTTKDGDTVDYIAWRYYGRQNGQVVEKLLQANQGLADRDPVLPPGIRITLPAMPTPAKETGVRLWD